MASFNSKSIFQYASSSDIVKLITATSLFFVCLQFTRLTFVINGEADTPFYTGFYNKIALPATFTVFVKQVWCVLTYMFAEMNFMRLLGDMIWLWIFSTVIEDLKGSNRIVPVYITGGLVGALCMLVFMRLKPEMAFSGYAGALGALSAVATAAIVYKPKYRFSMFFGIDIPIWIFAVIFFALEVLTVGKAQAPLIALALGGAITGLGYNTYMSWWFDRFTVALQKLGSYFGNNDHFLLDPEKEKRNQTLSHTPFKKVVKRALTMDELLDKINEKGINSLTADEKKRLEDYSKST